MSKKMHPRLYVKKNSRSLLYLPQINLDQKKKFNFRLGLFSGPNWFEQHEARYDGFVVYIRIKSSVPIETTNPLYLASGCSNQFGPENRPPLKFNFRGGLYFGPSWSEAHRVSYSYFFYIQILDEFFLGHPVQILV